MEVMVDLETLSTKPNAVILAIGAIKFNRNEGHITFDRIQEQHKFFCTIDIKSCLEAGLQIDENTVKWWDKQDPKIKQEMFEGKMALKQVLENFKTWYGNSATVWCQGLNFDIPILDEAFRKCNIETPWKFWQTRDTRTIYDISKVNTDSFPKGKLHHPLFDCFRQIYGVKESIRKLNLS